MFLGKHNHWMKQTLASPRQAPLHLTLLLMFYFTNYSRVETLDVFALGLFQELFGTNLVEFDLLYVCRILLHKFFSAMLSFSTSVEAG
jgi:hypothetical protein